jgi:GrpB-like predicted nucleotidyltransferase (UPF0157 family)
MRTVEVIDYRKSWIDQFNLEADILRYAIGFLNPVVHHVGSTSVAGLSAKPIIDILIEVDDVRSLDDHQQIFAAIGYLGHGENGIPERRYFEKGGDDRTHQIHAFDRGSYGATRHIAFRDYLVSHPQIAREYAVLKKQVALACNNDIDRYCAGKNEFIKKHEKLALEWYSHNKALHLSQRHGTG